jgi:hypothetical protein
MQTKSLQPSPCYFCWNNDKMFPKKTRLFMKIVYIYILMTKSHKFHCISCVQTLGFLIF